MYYTFSACPIDVAFVRVRTPHHPKRGPIRSDDLEFEKSAQSRVRRARTAPALASRRATVAPRLSTLELGPRRLPPLLPVHSGVRRASASVRVRPSVRARARALRLRTLVCRFIAFRTSHDSRCRCVRRRRRTRRTIVSRSRPACRLHSSVQCSSQFLASVRFWFCYRCVVVSSPVHMWFGFVFVFILNDGDETSDVSGQTSK